MTRDRVDALDVDLQVPKVAAVALALEVGGHREGWQESSLRESQQPLIYRFNTCSRYARARGS